MKQNLQKLLLAFVTVMWGFTQTVKASSSEYLFGWTEVTSLPTDNAELGRFFYVFIDASSDMMIAQEAHSTQENQLTAVYKIPATLDNSRIWTLEYNLAYSYGIRSLNKPTHLMQTRDKAPWRIQCAWEMAQSNWTQWDFAYESENKTWTIQNRLFSGDNFWGVWDPKVGIIDGAVLAGNKSGNDIGHFKIYSIPRVEYYSSLFDNASQDTPKDVTMVLSNADFSAYGVTKATTPGWAFTQKDAPNDWNYRSNNGSVELYHVSSDADFSYTIKGLKNGKYVIEAQMANGGNANTSYLYAETTPNINKATVTATGSNYDNVKNDFANDPNYGKLSVEAIVINGELKLGVGISANNNWVMFDNFTLTYYGTDLSELQKLLSQVVNTSQTLINNKTLPTTAEANLQKITTDNNPENGYENAEDYENAISTINAAYEKYNALVTPYAAYRAFRDNFVNADILDVTGVYTDANNAVATLNGAIEAANTAVEAATEISAITEQTAKLREAALKFIKTVTIKEGKYFDLTKLMANPGFDNNTTEGWNITHTGDLNTRVQCNEFYQATFDMYQTLTGLPNGSYTLSVKAFMRPGWADAVYTDYTNGINKVSAKLYVNNDESTIKNIMEHLQDTKLYNSENGGLADSEVNGKFIPNGMEGAQVYFGKGYYDTSVAALVNDGNLKLGFKNETSEGGYWTIFDDFRLHYYGTSEFIYKKQYFPQVQAEAQATLNNKLYENVAGAEKANLITAVAITPADTEEAYDVAITQIKDAQTAFIVVAPSYNRLVAAIATAKAQEVDCTDAESTLAAVTTTAEAAVSAANTLYTTVLNTFSMDEIQFGFVAGEYAPYNNVKAIQTYNKKAEAINNIASQSEADVNAMIEELKSVEWNVNTEEVNAVYDGNFAIQEAHENSGGLVLAGWDNSDDLLRQLVKNTTSYPGLSDADAQAAVFGWTSSHSYGKEAGYTLPLASHTIYELSYKYAGWATEDGENGRRSVSASILNATGETIATITPEGTCGIGYNNALKTAVLRFQTEEAENYTLVMTNNGNTVFTDIELLTAKAEDITVKVPAEYGTMILPFEAEIPAGMKVFGVENTTPNGVYNTLNLEPVLDKIEANTPYIVQKTDEVQSDEFVFNGVAYSDKDTYTSGLLTGAVKAVQAPAGSYVLQKLNNVLGFYKVVEGKSITVTAYHAYLAIAAASEVRAFVFDLNNDVTSVAAAVSGEDALTDVYSVDGVLVRKGVKASEALDGLQKGLYIVNGVKKAVR